MIAENETESELRRWASEQLEVPGDAPAAAVKGAFLRRLWADRFCPPASVRQAYEVLRDSDAADAADSPQWDEAWSEVMQRVRAEVEQFAEEFFQLPPAVRQARWEKLQRLSAPFSRIRARLRMLQYGLAVERKQHGEEAPLVDRLARACCALFVLRPEAQAVLRQSLEAEFADEASKWALTAKILRTQSPEIATLAPYLIEWLTTYTKRSEQTARAHSRAASAKATSWVPEPARVTRAPDDSASIWRVVVIGIIISSGLARFNSTSSPPRPSVNHSPPMISTIPVPKVPEPLPIESLDTSVIPPEIQAQAVELLDEKKIKEQREIERNALDLIKELLRQSQERAKQTQEKSTQNSEDRATGVPDPAKNPP